MSAQYASNNVPGQCTIIIYRVAAVWPIKLYILAARNNDTAKINSTFKMLYIFNRNIVFVPQLTRLTAYQWWINTLHTETDRCTRDWIFFSFSCTLASFSFHFYQAISIEYLWIFQSNEKINGISIMCAYRKQRHGFFVVVI